MTVGLKRDRLLRDDRGAAIASATRTLQLETEGLSALKAALAGDLVDSFAEAVEVLRSLSRPGHRHRHGQERPCRR